MLARRTLPPSTCDHHPFNANNVRNFLVDHCFTACCFPRPSCAMATPHWACSDSHGCKTVTRSSTLLSSFNLFRVTHVRRLRAHLVSLPELHRRHLYFMTEWRRVPWPAVARDSLNATPESRPNTPHLFALKTGKAGP